MRSTRSRLAADFFRLRPSSKKIGSTGKSMQGKIWDWITGDQSLAKLQSWESSSFGGWEVGVCGRVRGIRYYDVTIVPKVAFCRSGCWWKRVRRKFENKIFYSCPREGPRELTGCCVHFMFDFPILSLSKKTNNFGAGLNSLRDVSFFWKKIWLHLVLKRNKNFLYCFTVSFPMTCILCIFLNSRCLLVIELDTKNYSTLV